MAALLVPIDGGGAGECLCGLGNNFVVADEVVDGDDEEEMGGLRRTRYK